MTRVAIVGMACRYPDATSPRELWENALAGRRAFRRLPDERMRLEDYWDPDPKTPDKFYARNAAVIEGYEFDRIAYKVAGSTYRSTDLTHWLALDMAAMALADAGFPMAEGLPRDRTGVVVGNTLTGEFTRANQLRLRWPFVRRMVAAALKDQDWDDDHLMTFLDSFEATFKSPFPEVDEDTLAGGLSNTIAGRICNHFDLKGGGYTVDGACSSSLLSVATASKTLIDGDVDVAIAGGVDLSIDPFEIIGFAKTGALATGEMRVYDRGSNGFWPGEGCGMVVLMRENDARAAGHRIYATIAGWGISSDGKGGMTRPEVSGYRLALDRAYERAGFGIETVGLFEGHGTGTRVGDATELTALSLARRSADPSAAPAAIGSIKGMIGHTKAAAGVAGLIKAALAVHHQVLPPAIGCVMPHEILADDDHPALRALRKAEPWPDLPNVRAGVTAMGFGGINTHIVLEGGPSRRRRGFDSRTSRLASSGQDVELLLIDGASREKLRERLDKLVEFVDSVAYAQLGDLAATLHGELRDLPYRAAVVVSSPADAVARLQRLGALLDAGETSLVSADERSFLGHVGGPGRIGYLFPGQGSGRGTSGGALRRRFTEVDEVYTKAALPTSGDMVATTVAQPRIVTGSLAGLRVLSALGIEATSAVGHSLGEITALHWAGAFDEDALLRTAMVRGQTMAEHSSSGTMASIAAAPEAVRPLLADLPVVIGGFNGPQQTVIAGTAEGIEEACRRAGEAGFATTRLRVSHAFHSPLVAPAADAFGDRLTDEQFDPLSRRVVSTVTGDVLPADTDVPALLRRQITDPVLFTQAVAFAAKDLDLFIEVGPGRVLGALATAATDVPSVSLDTDDESVAGLLNAVGAAYVVGAFRVDDALFQGRLTRPLQLGAKFSFFASPCEAAPPLTVQPVRRAVEAKKIETDTDASEPPLHLLRRLVADRAELPIEMVRGESHLLDDLHLSSITVGQVVNQAAQLLSVPSAQTPTNFAVATVGELAQALEDLAGSAGEGGAATAATVAGAAAWSRAFSVDLDALSLPPRVEVEANGPWRRWSRDGDRLAESLRQALEHGAVGGGVLVCLPADCTEADLTLALDGAKAAIADKQRDRFVVVQRGRGAAGLAKSLRLEMPRIRTTIVRVPADFDDPALVVAEVAATGRFHEVRYDADGVRRVPTLRAMPVRPAREVMPLDASDVMLVTGGGKGITAECALAVAQDTGAALAVLGRSDPATDAELAANLDRMTAAGVRLHYARADVTDPAQVRTAVDGVRQKLGPVTAVLHGAGRNEPATLANLDAAAFRATFAPKIDGLRAVLDAVEPGALRMLVTFGSIIGRAGLRGEAHYATANDWLAEITADFAAAYPECRTLCLEWSVWSGVGMGERLSVVEGLQRDGIVPISPDEGVRLMRRLIADPDAPPVVVISGRTEGIDTVRRETPTLPLLRFVGTPLVHYHGVELVTEVELNAGTDLYLADHLLDGNLLFPAVFGMEAMAQTATALTGRAEVPAMEDVEFLRPIVVPVDGSATIRIAAVVTGDGDVDVAIRAADTGFAVDHFRARLRFGDRGELDGPPDETGAGLPLVPLDPATDLYGGILFQGQRFQRLRGYHRAAARHVDVDVSAVATDDWFASFLGGDLLLGDPGMRDALMHGLQVCVPHATLLPAGIERVHAAGPVLADKGEARFTATERSRDGDTYLYDIAVRTPGGEVVERWEGLRLQAVRKGDGRGPWAVPLLGPYLERSLDDLLGARVAVAVEPHGSDDPPRRAMTGLAAGRVFGRPVEVRYRPDGRPEVDDDQVVSAAHGAGVTVCVGGRGVLSCDIEAVSERDAETWSTLLGPHDGLVGQLTKDTDEDVDTASTRVWTAIECLRKVGLPVQTPITLSAVGPHGWLTLASGTLRIAVLVTRLRDHADPVVVAVLTDGWSLR
ncbi:type I polyketide synthase [Micromonospora foliorum]|uniref:type I polyketide synthase n=1 Tax=Micromonospora foliorum TaxID=2911210 RepID=UPI001EE8A122|nr:type I polyketide synthase [Micromonospora foliorum]MCG5438179.1 type I polyketide synthase [Micromonospora foliorum]